MPDASTSDAIERTPPPRTAAGRLPRPALSVDHRPTPSTDPIARLLVRVLLDPTTPDSLDLAAGLHGKLRARRAGQLNRLLGEYHALRCRLGRLGAVDIGLHSALDRASAAAAGAFCVERARQYEVMRLGLDHDLRGCVNAIRLAAFVQRDTARDTTDVVERQTSGLSALLARARDTLTLRADGAPTPADMPSEDLAAACRQQIRDWNRRETGPSCEYAAVGPCNGRFDAVRVREALDAMVVGAARRVEASSVLSVKLDSAQDFAVATVEGPARPAGGASRDRPAPDEWPLIWMLAQQTAADHHGTLETGFDRGRVVYRLALRAATSAGA